MRSAGYSVLVEVRLGSELGQALSSPPRLALAVRSLAAASQTSLLQVLSNAPDSVVIQQNSRDDLLVHKVFDAQGSAVVGMEDILERWSSFVVTARKETLLEVVAALKPSQGRYNVKEQVRVQPEVVLPASRR